MLSSLFLEGTRMVIVGRNEFGSQVPESALHLVCLAVVLHLQVAHSLLVLLRQPGCGTLARLLVSVQESLQLLDVLPPGACLL